MLWGAQVDALQISRAGNELLSGLMALLLTQQETPGSSWRVGVGRMEEHMAELQRAEEAAAGRLMLRQLNRSNARSRIRPAVMTVALVNQDVDGAEDGGAAAGGSAEVGRDGSANAPVDNAALTMELWRADLLAGTVELGPGCTIVRADAGMGLIFSLNPLKLQQHHLCK